MADAALGFLLPDFLSGGGDGERESRGGGEEKGTGGRRRARSGWMPESAGIGIGIGGIGR